MSEALPQAIVTGATGYVGREIVAHLRALGYAVTGLSKKGEDDTVSLDLVDATAVESWLRRHEEEQGPLALVVHAAGAAPARGPLSHADAALLREQIEGNFMTGAVFISACARRMQSRGAGVIIGITSSVAAHPETGKGMGAYVAAKCALHGFLLQLGAELASTGVRIHAVAPGLMEGGMNAGLPKAFLEIARAKTGALAGADTVASTVVRLAKEGGEASVLLAPEMDGYSR